MNVEVCWLDSVARALKLSSGRRSAADAEPSSAYLKQKVLGDSVIECRFFGRKRFSAAISNEKSATPPVMHLGLAGGNKPDVLKNVGFPYSVLNNYALGFYTSNTHTTLLPIVSKE